MKTIQWNDDALTALRTSRKHSLMLPSFHILNQMLPLILSQMPPTLQSVQFYNSASTTAGVQMPTAQRSSNQLKHGTVTAPSIGSIWPAI